jgi:hypothetical protein
LFRLDRTLPMTAAALKSESHVCRPRGNGMRALCSPSIDGWALQY